MLRYIKEEEKHLLVTGFSSERRIKSREILGWMQEQDITAQAFDAESIAGSQHVYYAVVNALAAFRTGENFTRSLHMEILLYVSGQDQIEKGLQIVGLKDTASELCLVVVASSEEETNNFQERFQRHFNLRRDDSILEIQNEGKLSHLKEVFSISDRELKAAAKGELRSEEFLRGLIIERGALLVTKR